MLREPGSLVVARPTDSLVARARGKTNTSIIVVRLGHGEALDRSIACNSLSSRLGGSVPEIRQRFWSGRLVGLEPRARAGARGWGYLFVAKGVPLRHLLSRLAAHHHHPVRSHDLLGELARRHLDGDHRVQLLQLARDAAAGRRAGSGERQARGGQGRRSKAEWRRERQKKKSLVQGVATKAAGTSCKGGEQHGGRGVHNIHVCLLGIRVRHCSSRESRTHCSSQRAWETLCA